MESGNVTRAIVSQLRLLRSNNVSPRKVVLGTVALKSLQDQFAADGREKDELKIEVGEKIFGLDIELDTENQWRIEVLP